MDIFVNLIASFLFVLIVAGWGRIQLAFKQWQQRPAAEQRRESDLESARRLAGSTQRLILLVAYVTLSSLGLLQLLGGGLLLWAVYVANALPIYAAIAAGPLLGFAFVCFYSVRMLDQVRDALVEEEKIRLSQLN